jgi:NADPH:quinone reductase-like Zn-dependent oxidoreductase
MLARCDVIVAEMMKVVQLRDPADARGLLLATAPRPVPGEGELLIEVSAAAVTPTELLWSPTLHTRSGTPRTNVIPGHEFSGVIAGRGTGVSGWELGQEVFGMNDWFADGAMAEFCTAPVSAVTTKPRRLSHAEASTVPISALTAWQGLFDRAKLQPGERVLVQGGAGAVGGFAVQFARLHGAHVIATASAANIEFVKSLGAAQVIDYRAQPFEEAAGLVDIVFDTVGGETLRRSWSILKPQGRIVTIAAGEEGTAEERVKQAFLLVEANGKQLATIADLLDSGKIRTVLDTVVPLSQAPEAFAGTVRRQGRGKVAVSILPTEIAQ